MHPLPGTTFPWPHSRVYKSWTVVEFSYFLRLLRPKCRGLMSFLVTVVTQLLWVTRSDKRSGGPKKGRGAGPETPHGHRTGCVCGFAILTLVTCLWSRPCLMHLQAAGKFSQEWLRAIIRRLPSVRRESSHNRSCFARQTRIASFVGEPTPAYSNASLVSLVYATIQNKPLLLGSEKTNLFRRATTDFSDEMGSHAGRQWH